MSLLAESGSVIWQFYNAPIIQEKQHHNSTVPEKDICTILQFQPTAPLYVTNWRIFFFILEFGEVLQIRTNKDWCKLLYRLGCLIINKQCIGVYSLLFTTSCQWQELNKCGMCHFLLVCLVFQTNWGLHKFTSHSMATIQLLSFCSLSCLIQIINHKFIFFCFTQKVHTGFPVNIKHAWWIVLRKCKGSPPAHLFLVVGKPMINSWQAT